MAVSPLTLHTALVCYWSADPVAHLEDFRRAGAGTYEDGLAWLRKNNLIGDDNCMTDKGRAWIEHMLVTPLPVQSWHIPDREVS